MKYNPTHLPDILDCLRGFLNIAVIYSGSNQKEGAVLHPTYHPRSWKSYQAVATDIALTLEKIGFRNVSLIPDDRKMTERLIKQNINLAWLNTGGVQGRNAIAHTPGMLDMLGIPYVGHSPLNYGVMDHKLTLKRLMKSFGIPTPAYQVWDPFYHSDPKAFQERFLGSLGTGGPWVVKPVTGRASQHTFYIEKLSELNDAIHQIYLRTHNLVLVEQYLPGREVCISGGPPLVYRNGAFERHKEPFVFSFVERLLRQDEHVFTSTDEKALDLSRARLIDETVEPALVGRMRKICRRLYRELSLKYLMRVDLREDAAGVLNLLEINPKPDLKKPRKDGFSLVALGLEREGMDYSDLIIGLLGSYIDFTLTYRPISVKSILGTLAKEGFAYGNHHPCLN